MPLRVVTLDAAGTLFAPAEPVGRTYVRIAARHGIRAEPGKVEAAFRRTLATAAPLTFPGEDPARLPVREQAWWAAVVRGAFGPLAARRTFAACATDLFAHYAEPAAWRVFPEVPAALAALRARGLRTAVVSNFDGRLPVLLAGLGLAPWLDAAVYSSRAGAAKPDPRIFAAALAALAATPGEALHAGDDPAADVGGARAAGLRAVLVDRRGAGGGDGERVGDLAALVRLADGGAFG